MGVFKFRRTWFSSGENPAFWDLLLGSGMRRLAFPADKWSTGPKGRVRGRVTRVTEELPWLGRAGECTDILGNWVPAPETRASVIAGADHVCGCQRGELQGKQKEKYRIGLSKYSVMWSSLGAFDLRSPSRCSSAGPPLSVCECGCVYTRV